MKQHLNNKSGLGLSIALATAFTLPLPALAASVALATSPLATSTTSSVKPNVMLIVDNSGSMAWDYMPDSVNNNNGKFCFRNSDYNRVYYNPNNTYALPLNSDGTAFANSSFTAAKIDGFSGTSTTDLSTQFKANSNDTAQAAYYYKYTGTTPATPVQGTCYADTSYTKVTVSTTSGPGNTDERQNFANWYSYYRTRLLMMKSATGRAFSELNNGYRVGLMKISQSNPLVNVNPFETTQRSTWYSSLYALTTSGRTPLRRSLSDAGTYYAGKLSGVTDPVQYSCQQNFTILSTDGYWNDAAGHDLNGASVGNQDGTAPRPMYDGTTTGTTVTTTYTRNSYSKSSTGCSSSKKRLVSQPQIQSCSVTAGVSTCTGWSSNGPSVYVSPYTSSTSTCSSSVTLPSPNPSTAVVSGSPVTTTGSTGGTSDTLADVAMYYYKTDLRTSALGNCTGALGSGTDVCANNVFISGTDNNTQQHMTTFTVGLGASGLMNYSSSYLSDTSGDFVSVKLGSTASSTASPPVCSWQSNGTTCNWPTPSADSAANIDDMWHAAVNGRGAYFSATDPASLAAGLSNALAGINARKGAAAAAATSTLNPVAGNNSAYVASYTTVAWKGNLESRGINIDTGVVSENATWCIENVAAGTCATTPVAEVTGSTTIYNCITPNAVTCTGGTLVGTDCKVPVATACTGTMNTMVLDASDTRVIKTANSTATALVDFTFTNLTATQKTYFDAAHIGTLSQWSSFTATQKTAAAGANLVNYLRGQYGYDDRTSNPAENRLYRYREATLGDALESQPAYIGSPVFSYSYPGYSAYKTAQANRAGTVFMGANDGMMHAFAADTGVERWAYVPSMVIPNLWKLADTNYSIMHTNYVNGSAITSDVCTANCTDPATAVWKTILVGGLNGGGRGYYALDITTPDSPSLLWEFTPTTGIGSVQDDDLGYSFGQAIITQKADGTWVVLVTSGYNNTNPGTGKGFLYVLNAGTGAIISKIATGVGSTTTPSGLAKIAGWNNESAGNKVGYVYGGDLLGNVWRFDVNSTTAAAIGTGTAFKFATLFSDTTGTTPQPVTTTPILGLVEGLRVIFIGTGKYLEQGDLSTTTVQTQYAIADTETNTTFVNPRNTLVQQTLTNSLTGTPTRSSTGNAVSFASNRGWYVDFPDSGERANIDSKLVQGILIVATIVPSNTVCSPGGYGWLNLFDYKTGAATYSTKSDSTIVGINMTYVQGKPQVSIVTSTNPTPTKIDCTDCFPPNAPAFAKKHTIWRELIP